MFTGLVESTGTIVKRTPLASGARFEITVPFAAELAIGESVSVSGVCLTVIEKTFTSMLVEVSTETEARTILSQLSAGAVVNLERAMLSTGRLGGHIVTGHIDAVGEIAEVEELGDFHRVLVDIPAAYEKLVIDKGSIAIDGISLTINTISHQRLEVMIIPHTWYATAATHWKVGVKINLEFDMIAKHLQKLSEVYRLASGHRDFSLVEKEKSR